MVKNRVCIKPRPNDRNMPTQHIATLLGATCWVRLATVLRCVATCWVLLAQVWPVSNLSQQPPTYHNAVAKRTQHVAPSNVAICCVGMLGSFCRGLTRWWCDVVMARAKRIYILIIKVNKLFSFFSSRCFLKEIGNMYSVFLSSYTNTRESLGELEKAFLVLPSFQSCLYKMPSQDEANHAGRFALSASLELRAFSHGDVINPSLTRLVLVKMAGYLPHSLFVCMCNLLTSSFQFSVKGGRSHYFRQFQHWSNGHRIN